VSYRAVPSFQVMMLLVVGGIVGPSLFSKWRKNDSDGIDVSVEEISVSGFASWAQSKEKGQQCLHIGFTQC
jgi:hypothetical protein